MDGALLAVQHVIREVGYLHNVLMFCQPSFQYLM